MLDKEQVSKVANLARLDLTEPEKEQFVTQLSSILEYFEQLSELDTDDVPPTTRAIDVSNITRLDQLQSTLEREALLEVAPDHDGEFYRVPKILSTDED